MLQPLLEQIMTALRSAGITEVYPSFDAVPFTRKSTECFLVVSPAQVQVDAPFPNGLHGAVPFTAVISVYLLTPASVPLSYAENLFYGTVLPQLETLGSVPCEVKSACFDVKLGRVVTEGRFRFNGVSLGEGAQS